jgi:hypothetical protein
MSDERAKQQAEAQLESIMEMVAALNCDYDRLEELRETYANLKSILEEATVEYHNDQTDENKEEMHEASDTLKNWEDDNREELMELEEAAGGCEDRDQAYERIQDDPLSVEVRGGWQCPGSEEVGTPEEFRILLCTGGPAVQIIGELDSHGYPDRARLQYQDWFTPWVEYIMDSDEHDAVLEYCQQFYFGG